MQSSVVCGAAGHAVQQEVSVCLRCAEDVLQSDGPPSPPQSLIKTIPLHSGRHSVMCLVR